LFISKPFDLDRVKLFVNRFAEQGMSHDHEEDHSNRWTGYETFEFQKHIARQGVMSSTTCHVVVSDDEQGEKRFNAGILEMSDTGMCIRTDYELKPGQLLRFSDNPVLSTGVVRWSKGGGEAEDPYHAGIQFVMPEGPLPHSD